MAQDPASGRSLPDNAIQRVLFATNDVHVYQIPPLTSSKGFNAASWTSQTQPTARQIFTARLRIIETSVESRIKADIVLEDPDGNLFAAAPYTSSAVVQPAQDSSRFFAVRVQGEGGMKATLGIGFEDRSPAFDFGIALAEVRKILDAEAGGVDARRNPQAKGKVDQDNKRDYSLKEGEKISIHVGSKGLRQTSEGGPSATTQNDSTALFSIAPPPPPATKAPVGTQDIVQPVGSTEKTAKDLGFDDGEFGEFQ